MALRRLVQLTALAATYVVVARLGLLFDAVSGFATLVWPPTGIAIAVLLLAGTWLWPGIFIGAFVVNVWTGAPIAVALGIATGNTLEAVIAMSILQHWRRFDRALADVRSVAGLVAVAVLATVASATVGVISLYAGAVIGSAQIGETWRAWWVGDLLGAIVVAPVILTWSRDSAARSMRSPEAVVAIGVLAATSWLVFGPTFAAVDPFPQGYAPFSVLTW